MIPKSMIFLFLLLCFSSSAQISDSQMESFKAKWRAELSEKGHGLAVDLPVKDGISDFSDSIQRLFLEDTFVVENLLRLQLEKESTTLGINKAHLACASEYEKLVGKYFSILQSKMLDEDKELLDSWQNDWKTLMDHERILIGKLMQEPYSGGGSIHSIEYTRRLMNQQKSRLLLMIDYLTHMI